MESVSRASFISGPRRNAATDGSVVCHKSGQAVKACPALSYKVPLLVGEIFEESGLSIQNPKLCGLLMFPKFKGDDWYVFVFTANEFSGGAKAPIDSPEGKLEWIPDEKILDLKLWESDHIFFPWIQSGEFFSAKFEYEGNEMRGYDVVFH